MKKVIDGKMYNTETATKLGLGSSNTPYVTDFRHFEEELYRTKHGQYFLAGHGGPMSHYAHPSGDMTSGGSNLFLLSEDEALEWCEKHLKADKIVEIFGSEIEEG